MKTLFLTLTTDCNRQCGYCFYVTGRQRKAPKRLDKGMILDFASSLKRYDELYDVIITGGEPFLVENLFEIIEGLSGFKLQAIIVTNGDFLSGETILKAKEAGAFALSISIDSFKDGKNLLQRVKKEILESQIPTTIITPITRTNIWELEDILHLSKLFYGGHILQPAFIPEDDPSYDKLSINKCTPHERRELKRILGLWSETFGTRNYTRLIDEFYNLYPSKNRSAEKPNPDFCPMGTEVLVLNSDGSIIPCFHREDLYIGNILNVDFCEISKEMYKFSETLIEAPCFGEHCISLFTNI